MPHSLPRPTGQHTVFPRKNPWGDPLLVHQPISGLAIAAFVASLVTLGCATLTLLWPTQPPGQVIYAPAVVGLLVLLQAIGTAASFLLAYGAFATCRLSALRPGRGLAWAALAISYGSAVWLLIIVAGLWPSLGWLTVVVTVLGLLHIPAFAAESSFGKQLVMGVVVGGAFFSLLSCALLHSRENARIRQCQNNLREMGTNLMLASDLHVEQHASPRADNDELTSLLQQVLDEAQRSDSSRGAPAE